MKNAPQHWQSKAVEYDIYDCVIHANQTGINIPGINVPVILLNIPGINIPVILVNIPGINIPACDFSIQDSKSLSLAFGK